MRHFRIPNSKHTAMMTVMWTLITIIEDNTQQPWLRLCGIGSVYIFYCVSGGITVITRVMTRETALLTAKWQHVSGKKRTVSLVPGF